MIQPNYSADVSGNGYFLVYDSNNVTAAEANNLVPGNCYDFAITNNALDSVAGLNLYVNGTLVDTEPGIQNIGTVNFMTITAPGTSASGETSTFDSWRFSSVIKPTFPTLDGTNCSPTVSPTGTRTATPTPTVTASPTVTVSPTGTRTATPACGIYGQQTPQGINNSGEGVMFFKPVTLTFAYLATVQTISAFIKSGQGQMQGAVYSDFLGAPFQLIETSNMVYTSPQGWNSVTFSTDNLAPGNYWLAVEVSNSNQIAYAANGTDLFSYQDFGVWPQTAQVQDFLGTANIQGFACGY